MAWVHIRTLKPNSRWSQTRLGRALCHQLFNCSVWRNMSWGPSELPHRHLEGAMYAGRTCRHLGSIPALSAPIPREQVQLMSHESLHPLVTSMYTTQRHPSPRKGLGNKQGVLRMISSLKSRNAVLSMFLWSPRKFLEWSSISDKMLPWTFPIF